ncbi:glycosyltransferase family 4 protein [Salinimicrobium oceani]|uniref:Glycosyltransferase family 4 protein n=1 Tax=Salinimicrobium oceani TaxID=2722702 RepID=A0ABX1D1A3_9FLAO|nr:glycosyltransferase family 4 protein [Salinimicrobium oceani]NJW54135.1 glycosyltransferase family 4 protein [Salinimicrobium oceani]
MKKVLIVTYYWPPAGGPGVQRWLKFVKYLPEFGIEPVVYVPANPHYPLQDPSLEQEIPSGIKVLKNDIFEPYSLAKFFSRKDTTMISSGIIPKEQKQGLLQKTMLFIRGNFFIPDARKFWIKPSVKFLSAYLEEEELVTIITTGPPHSLHLIGLGLKRSKKINWIADFRDPWTQIGYHDKLRLTKTSQRKHEALERKVLQTADKVITTSFTTQKEFMAKTDRPVAVITNGFDVEDVERLPLDEHFSLAHIGSLLSGRNPENLWKALAELTREKPDFKKDLQLKLIGAVGEPVLESIEEFELNDHLVRRDYVSHREALQMQRSSQVLLLIEIDSEETKGIIPGKLFEYMVSERPILAVGPEAADIEQIIRKTNSGRFFLYPQKGEIKAFLLECYELFKSRKLKASPVGVQQYSRRSLTAELAQQIKSL